jgi:hypothetical protein
MCKRAEVVRRLEEFPGSGTGTGIGAGVETFELVFGAVVWNWHHQFSAFSNFGVACLNLRKPRQASVSRLAPNLFCFICWKTKNLSAIRRFRLRMSREFVRETLIDLKLPGR